MDHKKGQRERVRGPPEETSSVQPFDCPPLNCFLYVTIYNCNATCKIAIMCLSSWLLGLAFAALLCLVSALCTM